MKQVSLPWGGWRPRDYQMGAWRSFRGDVRRQLLIWHRRAGKDEIILHNFAVSAFERVGNYWHLLPTHVQARRAMWQGVNPKTGRRRIFDAFGPRTGPLIKSINDAEMLIEFTNGSTYQVFGSDNYDSAVGSGPVGIAFSEFALAKPDAWTYFSPMLVENNGWGAFISTPRGANHLMALYEEHRDDPAWFVEKLTVDDTGIIDAADLEADLKTKQATLGKAAGLSKWDQEWRCFPPGTPIWTATGQRPIESVGIGDVVLTHAGRWRPVTKLYKHQTEDDIVVISSAGSPDPLICTHKHPVRVCDPPSQTYAWKPAGQVKAGDYVVLPRLKVQARAVIPEGLATLIGWFIAEGTVDGNRVAFSLGASEDDFASVIGEAAGLFGEVSISKGRGAQVVRVNSCWLADFLLANCGDGAAGKRIPWQLIAGHEGAVYEALIDGDGCRGDYAGSSEVYTTVSYGLALDVQMLAHMLGKRARVNMRPAEKQTTVIEGRTVKVRDSYSVRVCEIRRTTSGRPRVLPQKHGVAALVTWVERRAHAGVVHNFSVKNDESYVAAGRVVHNCSFEAPTDDSFITLDTVAAAMGRRHSFDDVTDRERVIGVDVARYGDDRSVIFKRQGPLAYPPEVRADISNTDLAGLVAQTAAEFKPHQINIDAGRGEGVIDRLRAMGFTVTEVNFGGSSGDPHCANKKAEMWSRMRKWIDEIGQLPQFPDLRRDLTTPQYAFNGKDQLVIEGKKEIKRRGYPSPDLADALALTFAAPVVVGGAHAFEKRMTVHRSNAAAKDAIARFIKKPKRR